jgi:hypothetical protein
MASSSVNLAIVDEQDPFVSYSGTWSTAGSPAEFSGTTKWSAIQGSTASFTFVGAFIPILCTPRMHMDADVHVQRYLDRRVRNSRSHHLPTIEPVLRRRRLHRGDLHPLKRHGHRRAPRAPLDVAFPQRCLHLTHPRDNADCRSRHRRHLPRLPHVQHHRARGRRELFYR